MSGPAPSTLGEIALLSIFALVICLTVYAVIGIGTGRRN